MARATGGDDGDGERLPLFRKDFPAPAKHRYFLYFTRRMSQVSKQHTGALFLRCPKAIPWINDFLISSSNRTEGPEPSRKDADANGRCRRRKIGTANRPRRSSGWNAPKPDAKSETENLMNLQQNIPEDALSSPHGITITFAGRPSGRGHWLLGLRLRRKTSLIMCLCKLPRCALRATMEEDLVSCFQVF